jgi:hypothetical protein
MLGPPGSAGDGLEAMGFADLLAGIREPALREIALHWRAAKGARRMPGWRDIDPAAIARHLPIVWSWAYDRATDSFTGRLAGEEINAVFGKSLRGAKMREFFAEWRYDDIFARSKRVVTGPAFAHGSGSVFAHAGRHGSGERIILPLAANGSDGDGLIGATVYHWEPSSLDAVARQKHLAEEIVDYFALD